MHMVVELIFYLLSSDPAQAQVHLEDVQYAEGVMPVEYFKIFPSFSVFVCRGSKPFIQPQFADDALLKCFAEKGVWEHWVRYCSDGAFTEEGLLDFCLGDYPPNEHYRHLHVENASLSTRFLQKIVEVRSVFLTLNSSDPSTVRDRQTKCIGTRSARVPREGRWSRPIQPDIRILRNSGDTFLQK